MQAQTIAQVGTFDSAQRTTLFRHLSEQYEANQKNVQRLFTEARLATLRDPGADIAAHKAARNFLVFASGGTYYGDKLDKIEVAPQ